VSTFKVSKPFPKKKKKEKKNGQWLERKGSIQEIRDQAC